MKGVCSCKAKPVFLSPSIFRYVSYSKRNFANQNGGKETVKVSPKFSSPLLETTSLISKPSSARTASPVNKNITNTIPEQKVEPRWNPARKLVRSDMEKLRELHQKDPKTNSISQLSKTFKISPEAVNRILRSKWSPPPETVVRQDVKKMIERKFAASHGTIPYRIKEQLELLSQVSKIWENNPKDHEATIHLHKISKEITSLTKSLLPAKVLATIGITDSTPKKDS